MHIPHSHTVSSPSSVQIALSLRLTTQFQHNSPPKTSIPSSHKLKKKKTNRLNCTGIRWIYSNRIFGYRKRLTLHLIINMNLIFLYITKVYPTYDWIIFIFKPACFIIFLRNNHGEKKIKIKMSHFGSFPLTELFFVDSGCGYYK